MYLCLLMINSLYDTIRAVMINLGQFFEYASLDTQSFVMRTYRAFDRDSCSFLGDWLHTAVNFGVTSLTKVKVDNSLAAFLQTTMGGKATVWKTLTQLLKWLLQYDESLYICNLSSVLLFDDGNCSNCSRYSLKVDTPSSFAPTSFTVKLFQLLYFKNVLLH